MSNVDGSSKKEPKIITAILIIAAIVTITGVTLKDIIHFHSDIAIPNGSIDEIKGHASTSNFPNQNTIENLINGYYSVIKNNKYNELDLYFSSNVNRYFSEFNVDGASIKDKTRKYEENLGVYQKTFNVRWNSLVLDKNNEQSAKVNYLLEYSLDCRKLGHKEYLINVFLELNNNYQITSMYETILQ